MAKKLRLSDAQFLEVITHAVKSGLCGKGNIASILGLTPEEFEKRLQKIENEIGVKFPERYTQSKPPEIIKGEKKHIQPLDLAVKNKSVFIRAVKAGLSFAEIGKIFNVSQFVAQMWAETFVDRGAIKSIPKECYPQKTEEPQSVHIPNSALKKAILLSYKAKENSPILEAIQAKVEK